MVGWSVCPSVRNRCHREYDLVKMEPWEEGQTITWTEKKRLMEMRGRKKLEKENRLIWTSTIAPDKGR